MITVTEALTKLKLYDKRITDKVNALRLATFVTGNTRPEGCSTPEEYVQQATANLQSADALIVERQRLKRAIVSSNARTPVKVGDVEMSVADAIELKSSIAYRKTLLGQMKTQYAQALTKEQSHNQQVNLKADEFVQKSFPNQANLDMKTLMEAREAWIKANQGKTLAANGLKAKIDEIEQAIGDFESNVDVALSLVNATTVIEV